jgi:hypothetical protein
MTLVAKEPLEDAAAGPPLDEGEGTQRKERSAVICITLVYVDIPMIRFQDGQEMRTTSGPAGCHEQAIRFTPAGGYEPISLVGFSI